MNLFKAGVAAPNYGLSYSLLNKIPIELRTGGDPDKGVYIYENYAKMPTSTTSLSGYTVTNVNGTLVPTGAAGGGIVLTCNGADNDGIQLQTAEFASLTGTGRAVAECKVQLVDADQSDFFYGFSITDTTILAGAPTDYIGLLVADGSANLGYIVSKDSAGAFVDTGTDLVDATDIRLGMYIQGDEFVEFYVNGAKVATVTSGIPNDEVLAASLAHLAGAGAANNATVKWNYWAFWND